MFGYRVPAPDEAMLISGDIDDQKLALKLQSAVESAASTVDEVIAEVQASRLTERGATRADDRLSEAAMEDRKREGYF